MTKKKTIDSQAAHLREYWDDIEAFGHKMLKELLANDAQKGNFSDWKPGREQAQKELEHHFLKLFAAIQARNATSKARITECAADLANVILVIERSLGAP